MGQITNIVPGAARLRERDAGVRADNTALISEFPGGMPQFAAGSRFVLNGLGDGTPLATGNINDGDANGPGGSILNTLTSPGVMPAINSEAVFLTNLLRSWNGQGPVSVAASAPAVNVGLTTETMIGLGALALGLFAFAKKRRR